jgi:hypothetical protein
MAPHRQGLFDRLPNLVLAEPLLQAMPVEAPPIPNLVGWDLPMSGHAVDGHLVHPEIASYLSNRHYRLVLTIGRHQTSSGDAQGRLAGWWPPAGQAPRHAGTHQATYEFGIPLPDIRCSFCSSGHKQIIGDLTRQCQWSKGTVWRRTAHVIQYCQYKADIIQKGLP